MADSSAAILPRGAGRLDALNALERALAVDTMATLHIMVGSGWPAEAALDHYRFWLGSLVDAAVDQGVAEWLWEAS